MLKLTTKTLMLWHDGRDMAKNGRDMLKKAIGDRKGAALIEYTVLLGILVVAVIATIVAVGGWVNDQWVALESALPS